MRWWFERLWLGDDVCGAASGVGGCGGSSVYTSKYTYIYWFLFSWISWTLVITVAEWVVCGANVRVEVHLAYSVQWRCVARRVVQRVWCGFAVGVLCTACSVAWRCVAGFGGMTRRLVVCFSCVGTTPGHIVDAMCAHSLFVCVLSTHTSNYESVVEDVLLTPGSGKRPSPHHTGATHAVIFQNYILITYSDNFLCNTK